MRFLEDIDWRITAPFRTQSALGSSVQLPTSIALDPGYSKFCSGRTIYVIKSNDPLVIRTTTVLECNAPAPGRGSARFRRRQGSLSTQRRAYRGRYVSKPVRSVPAVSAAAQHLQTETSIPGHTARPFTFPVSMATLASSAARCISPRETDTLLTMDGTCVLRSTCAAKHPFQLRGWKSAGLSRPTTGSPRTMGGAAPPRTGGIRRNDRRRAGCVSRVASPVMARRGDGKHAPLSPSVRGDVANCVGLDGIRSAERGPADRGS